MLLSTVLFSQEEHELKTKKGLQISIYGGYSYRTTEIDDNMPSWQVDYIKGLKSGFHIGTDLTYYFYETTGAGLKFNMSKASNHLNNVTVTDDIGDSYTGAIEDNTTIIFIGPAYTTRYFVGDRGNAFIANIALGYLSYSNDVLVPNMQYKITGETFGSAMDLGYEYILKDNLAINIQLSAVGGVLKKQVYKLSDGRTYTDELEKGNYIGLHRIDLSIGFVYNL